jgi:cytochrome c-type biogenesis protein CcmF
MTPELGHFALILAFVATLMQGVLPLIGAQRSQAQWIALARPAAQTHFLLLAFSFVCLAQSFLANDFSVAYVAQNSNTQLPAIYRFAAVWGGHEGSLLLWVLMLSGWGAAVSVTSRQLPEVMVARVLGVLGLVSVGMLAFILFTSNPFARLLPAAAEGSDLNPLLQDPGLVFHPPMLYMGYVGFAVAFAFAIAALISGRLDAAWARWSRPWTTAAWCFLTIGIAMGSWWAYYELGWGRLVVLGSGGKCFLHALAGGYGADPFAGHYRKTRRVQELDGAAGNCRIFVVAAGHFSRAFRRAHFSACFRL